MRLIDYLKSPCMDSNSICSFKIAFLRKDIFNSFTEDEDAFYTSIGFFELFMGYKRITTVILYRGKVEVVFDCDDINQDESYLILRYGKILLKEIEE